MFFEALWGALEGSWEALGRLLEALGGLLEPFGDHMGALEGSQTVIWVILEAAGRFDDRPGGMCRALGEDYRRGSEAKKDQANQEWKKEAGMAI